MQGVIWGRLWAFDASISVLRRAAEVAESGGSVTKAAQLLGLTHQTLISILITRHKALSEKRKAPQKRLKSIIKKNEK